MVRMRVLDVAEVVLGAGVGGGLRYLIGGWLSERWGASFPWHTLAINVGGAFFLGMLMALTAERGILSPGMRLLLGVGLLGGFTTFSTLSYESVALIEQGRLLQGAANMLGSGLFGVMAAMLGLIAGRAI